MLKVAENDKPYKFAYMISFYTILLLPEFWFCTYMHADEFFWCVFYPFVYFFMLLNQRTKRHYLCLAQMFKMNKYKPSNILRLTMIYKGSHIRTSVHYASAIAY